HLLSISIDPAYDTPARLAEYARPYLGEGGQWTFATGATADIQKLGEAFGLMVARNGEQIDHTLRTVVVDATGRVRKVFTGNGWQSAELLDEMRRAMDASP
ncbi:MAG: SCO family protein, partial [Chthoniobacteraceae bacterium]